MGALLLAAGEKGKRFALPHSRILIHQPLGGFQGQATDIDIQAREILRLKDRLNAILSELTGQPCPGAGGHGAGLLFGEPAGREYGIIDEVLEKRQ